MEGSSDSCGRFRGPGTPDFPRPPLGVAPADALSRRQAPVGAFVFSFLPSRPTGSPCPVAAELHVPGAWE